MVIRIPRVLALLVGSIVLSSVTTHAQPAQPVPAMGAAPAGRVGFEFAAGPLFEVATAGDRASQRGVLAVPAVGIKVASWFEYTVEGHLSRHITPVSGNVFGIVPIGFRINLGPRRQVHVSAGAGVTWTDLTGLRGIEQRRNFITQVGGGFTKTGANGSGVFLEARFFHLSNLHAAPPNLGIEGVAVLVGYRLPR